MEARPNTQSNSELCFLVVCILLCSERINAVILSGVGVIQGNGYFVELYTTLDVLDLSQYSMLVNGYLLELPSDSMQANSYYYVTNKKNDFLDGFFGEDVTEYFDKNLNLKDGDDVVELFFNSVVSTTFA